ncbi:hypothetical protein [Kitasatospora sp. NPDC001175]|uniref:hypothetical protein n=1 Tax=Kitasatospora sp. NPDC001175 TaxID=3157103 RepID=UPI003D0450B1
MRWLVLAAVVAPAWMFAVVCCVAVCRGNRAADQAAAERAATNAVIAAMERQFAERIEP